MAVPFEAISVPPLDRAHERGVQRAPAVAQEASIGDLLGQRVLEGVFEIREEADLVEELGGLEVSQPTPQVFFGQLGNGEQKRERHVLADHRGRLKQPLGLRC